MAFSPKSLSRFFQSHTLYYYVSAMCILFLWVAVNLVSMAFAKLPVL